MRGQAGKAPVRRLPRAGRHLDGEQHGVDVRFSGVGGPSMRAQGLEPIFDMSELAVMGVFELLPHLFRLRWRLRDAIAHIQDEQPDILVTIDAKGFNFRLLRALADAPALAPRPTVAHYVAPSIWAYKGSLRTPPDRARPAPSHQYLQPRS